jgi:hypothetical protein
MQYRCPVCGFTTDFDGDLARHMTTTAIMHDYHQDWIESRGVGLPSSSDWASGEPKKEYYMALQGIIRGECRVEDE